MESPDDQWLGCTFMNAIPRGVWALAMFTLVATSGCIPTISRHSYRDVTVTITEVDSGKAVPLLPFRVVYDYAPADSPLVYHVELRTPRELRAETDKNGKTVVKLADYAWNILLEVDESEKGDWDRFWLSKALVRKGGVVETRYKGQKHRKLRLELRPVEQPNHTMQRMGASRLAQSQIESPWRLAPTADGDR
jgi:hypothetical protein